MLADELDVLKPSNDSDYNTHTCMLVRVVDVCLYVKYDYDFYRLLTHINILPLLDRYNWKTSAKEY